MVLNVHQLCYRHARALPPALDGIDLQLSAGEILCLLGPNGSGKTTLLRCLIGALQPEEGEIRIGGDAAQTTARERARCMAYVPQAAGDSALSLFDTVLMGRTPYISPLALPGPEDAVIARDALERVGIVELADRPFNRASGGERQLALIARALAQQPLLLLMDEPTASLDLGNQARVLRTIRQLAAGGMAVLLTTHQPEHALLLGARVAAISAGRIVAHGPAHEVVCTATLSHLYRTSVEIVHHRGAPVACVPCL